MKKTLMALALAFCATVAFAQVPRNARVQRAVDAVGTKVTTNMNDAQMQRQNAFKGSIFTKAALFTEDFNSTSSTYSVGHASGANYQASTYAQWVRVGDTSMATCNSQTVVNQLPNLFGTNQNDYFNDGLGGLFESTTPDNGFMVMSMWSQVNAGTPGNFDSWITFDSVQPTPNNLYDVTFYQYFRKFNFDSCFVEYSSNGSNWNSIYINRRGIDVATNGILNGEKTVSLPLAVAAYQNLYLRIRWKSDSNAGGAYGYWWMIDDVTIDTASTRNRLDLITTKFYDGGYHIVPQGMGGNAFLWDATFRNNGSATQTNLKAEIKNGSTVLAQSQTISSLPHDVLNDTFAFIDPNGRMENYYEGSTTTFGTAGYVPSTTAGVDSLTVSFNSDDLVFNIDTIKYVVNNGSDNGRVWGRDNGVLTGYSYWPYGMSADGYITTDADLGEAGFSLRVMYGTPATVPSGWVIRGVEIVPSTRPNYVLPGAELAATLTIDSVAGTSVYFLNQNTGASNYTVQQADVNAFIPNYYQFGNYNTIRITFPSQPELRANQKYWIGYTMAQSGTFVPATDRSFYYDSDSMGTSLPNRLGHRFSAGANPNIFVLQPSYAASSLVGLGITGANTTPMIRMIVGPRQVIPDFDITWNVTPANGGDVTDMSDYQVVTGTTIQKPQGSTTRFAIEENTDANFELTGLTVNGVNIDMINDPNFVAESGFFSYYIVNLQENKTCTATFSDGGPHGSINGADNAVVKVQPNPATSVANLTIEGVNGNVNFALIDMNGRVISEKVINANAIEMINLEGLARGTYFVRITNNNFSKVEKLIVR